MSATTTTFDLGMVTDRPYREVIGRAARVAPGVMGATALLGILLGGSLWVCLAVAAVGALTLVPRIRAVLPRAPRHVIAGWIGLFSITTPALAADPDTFELAAVAGAALILFARLVSNLRIRRVILGAVIGLQLTGWLVIGQPVGRLWALAGLAVVALGTEYLTAIHRAITAGSEHRVRELSDERWSLIRLYEIASSIGTSTTKAEALPDLLASIADAMGVTTCAVVLSNSDLSSVTLAGPVWVNGRPIPVDDEVVVNVTDGGFTCRAMRSRRAIRFDRSNMGALRDIAGEIGLDAGLVTPLRLEGRDSGLIIVGDPIGGAFSGDAIANLTDLAIPAGLVIAQVERHESAALLAERLKEIADMKTDLVSMVSHELRTPLTSVIGSLDILARPDVAADDELSAELLDTANRQAHRLKRLIDDLLTVSRIDRGLIRPEPVPVDLAEAVAEAVWVVGNASVEVSIPEGLAATADPHHLGQVIVNLVENASKYAPGSPIVVAAEQLDDGGVVLAVADHGPGIPVAQRDRVFERFVRLPGAENAGGTGLGLAIVSMLVENMHGRVDVLDTPGGGATFAVSLPGAEPIPPIRRSAA